MLMATHKYRNRFQLSDGIKYGSKASIDATKNGKIRLERFDLFESAEAEMPERSFLQIRVGSEKFEKYIVFWLKIKHIAPPLINKTMFLKIY